jgi:endonuclease G, mitochondrial
VVELFREHDVDRLTRRISAVSGGDLRDAQIRELIGGDTGVLAAASPRTRGGIKPLIKDLPSIERELSPRQAEQLEILVGGDNEDWLPIHYVDLVRRAADAVARVAFLDGTGQGTGIMISPRLFMTNQHVVPTAVLARGFKAQFDFESTATGENLPSVDVRFAPEDFFWCSPEDLLDVTIVAVNAAATARISRFGWAPLSSAMDKHATGDFVTVIQHPRGARKQVALRENRILGRGRKGVTIHYSADTIGGSSGSPVFNDQLDLIALHHAWGGKYDDFYEDGTQIPDESNEGIRVSCIVDALRALHDGLPEAPRMLLAEALNPPTTTAIRVSAERLTAVALGSATSPAGAGEAAGAIPVRSPRPDPAYGNRRGYDPDFLARPVRLPTLTADDLASCARLQAPVGRRNPYVLNYHHFSAMVHAGRRLPVLTAVNIDGASARSINRDTGQVESNETWYSDPRIDPRHQLDQHYYAEQRPLLFDRGHLVRRLDPAWGDDHDAFDAALDTFHFTNCCPQISSFNRQLWLSLEDYALKNARAEQGRITVLSGPLFTARDPRYRGVRVPRKFWKVVVRVCDGNLRVTAFIADQGPQLDLALATDQQESFDDLGKVAVYHRPLAEVSRLSKLRFVGLARADTHREPSQLETSGAITSPGEASW